MGTFLICWEKGTGLGRSGVERSCARAVERVDVRYGFLGSADSVCQRDRMTAGRARMVGTQSGTRCAINSVPICQ